MNGHVFLFAGMLGTLLVSVGQCNDGAAETAAGGIRLKTERRISMVKERLSISKEFLHKDKSSLDVAENKYRVVVKYEFLNKSTANITTEVAFPLPEYRYPYEDLNGVRKISGFTVDSDGRPIKYHTDVRALVEGADITKTLKKLKLDIPGFAGYDHATGKGQLKNLPEPDKEMLEKMDATKGEAPNWTVATTYHWGQTFPAGKPLAVRHEYNAIPGFSYGFGEPYLNKLSEEEAGCFSGTLVRNLTKSFPNGIRAQWVKYILTTANTWEMPIRDFELIVDYPKGQYASFCWDGKLEQVSDTRIRATANDFIPQKELVVYFFSALYDEK